MRSAFFCLVVALLLQMITIDGFAWLSEAAYGKPRLLAEALELPLTYIGLVLAGPLALVVVTRATFLFWRRTRLWVAIPCSVLVCLPSLTVAMLFTHSLLCIRNWW